MADAELEQLAAAHPELAALREKARGHRRRGSTRRSRRLRVRYLGRKSRADRDPARASPTCRRSAPGRRPAANEARAALEAALEARAAELGRPSSMRSLAHERIDVTLPGEPLPVAAHQHLITQTQREIEDIFVGLGYRVIEGPEVELDYYNFTALNHPPGHPARMAQDTFYVDPRRCAQTSDASTAELPPGRGRRPAHPHLADAGARDGGAARRRSSSSCPGRCYRRDPFDATHSPMFHQVEGLAVGEGITLADLKGTLDDFARAIFGPEREIALPAALLPVHRAERRGRRLLLPLRRLGQAARRLARPALQGHRLDRDPRRRHGRPERVRLRRRTATTPSEVQGFAFGMGIERIAMLKHGVPDLRMFFENDVRVLEQFR